MGAFRTATLVGATLTTGLMAGLFYAWAISVMPGLGRSDDRTFVEAMQHMNEAILNGWFALCFVGALALSALAALLHLGRDLRSVLPWIIAALVLYVAALAITFGVNVPLTTSSTRPEASTALPTSRRCATFSRANGSAGTSSARSPTRRRSAALPGHWSSTAAPPDGLRRVGSRRRGLERLPAT